jgi:tellurite resistance protein TehA-like permease
MTFLSDINWEPFIRLTATSLEMTATCYRARGVPRCAAKLLFQKQRETLPLAVYMLARSSGQRCASLRAMKFLRRAAASVGPAWFSIVMGTGALGLAIVASPIPIPAGGAVGSVIWWLATAVFAIISPLMTLRVLLSLAGFLATLRDSATAQLWGLPPMAAFIVVIGLVRIVAPHGGGHLAIVVAQGLCVFAVAGSLLTAFVVPYLMVTEHELRLDAVLGSWVLPLAPPVVAAVPAALLLPTFPAALRPSILVIACVMLSAGLALTALTIGVYYARLLFHKLATGGLAPGMWLVVGPLGQSQGPTRSAPRLP